MPDSAVKWIFIAMMSPMAFMAIGTAVEGYSKNMAKRDIIVACYQAGNKDCDRLWNKEIK